MRFSNIAEQWINTLFVKKEKENGFRNNQVFLNQYPKECWIAAQFANQTLKHCVFDLKEKLFSRQQSSTSIRSIFLDLKKNFKLNKCNDNDW